MASIITDPTKLAELPFVVFDLAANFALSVFDFVEQILRVTI